MAPPSDLGPPAAGPQVHVLRLYHILLSQPWSEVGVHEWPLASHLGPLFLPSPRELGLQWACGVLGPALCKCRHQRGASWTQGLGDWVEKRASPLKVEQGSPQDSREGDAGGAGRAQEGAASLHLRHLDLRLQAEVSREGRQLASGRATQPRVSGASEAGPEHLWGPCPWHPTIQGPPWSRRVGAGCVAGPSLQALPPRPGCWVASLRAEGTGRHLLHSGASAGAAPHQAQHLGRGVPSHPGALKGRRRAIES